MAKRDEIAVVFQLDHSRYKAYFPPLKVSGIGLHPTRKTHPSQKARRVGHPAPGTRLPAIAFSNLKHSC
jgi:hypothetical protein